MDSEKIISELNYKAVRSSGAGGQNVNKVSSKVVLSFSVPASAALTDEEKSLITTQLSSRLTEDNILILQCDEDRSQLRNKDIVTRRFLQIMLEAVKPQKVRRPTKTPRSVIKKRLEGKRRNAEKKQSRKRPDF
ncbi:alternative ribosome rescue aminoacyl-tRNA hydrolase ArfB [Flavobacterium rhizosphaerae]|uniref:Alternative ribosome rescue aminoacyl-tRNA hydrolase ArfB n=1 Tax=Flavobacterium rhizosphaerae TaxID=3163298 RepID=A0ABW8YYH7_9FLAO